MLLRDRSIVLVLGIALLAAFVGYGAAFAGCPQDSKWTAADEKKGKEILNEVMENFRKLEGLKDRLETDPNDYAAREEADRLKQKMDDLAKDAFKDDLAEARKRVDKLAVRKLTKIRSKLMSMLDEANALMDGVLDINQAVTPEGGRDITQADIDNVDQKIKAFDMKAKAMAEKAEKEAEEDNDTPEKEKEAIKDLLGLKADAEKMAASFDKMAEEARAQNEDKVAGFYSEAAEEARKRQQDVVAALNVAGFAKMLTN